VSGPDSVGDPTAERQTVGSVPVRTMHDAAPGSFDGHEATLWALFDRPESERRSEIAALLATAPDWLTQYHLSPQRRMVLSWAQFDPEETVLEVGAGCGAITGLLTERAGRVLANEKFLTRGEVIARRYADRPNLEILVGGLDAIELDRQVDTVVCIGVWEYAGVFLESDPEHRYVEPFRRFLATLRQLVRPGGRLLLAIENKLGVQYLAGAEEDHLHHGVLAGVEGYPDYAGARTFSRREIRGFLEAAGFGDPRFYLPFPDYKLPSLVLREDAAARLGLHASELGALIPWHRPRLPLINEMLLTRALLDEGLLASFANSFVVDAPA
jgi:SAM-dependent methyltransferase